MSYLNEKADKLQLSTISSKMLMTYEFCVYEYTLVGTIYRLTKFPPRHVWVIGF